MKHLGLENGCAATLGDIEILRHAGLKIYSGFSLNVLNSLAIAELERLGVEDITLSIETAVKNTRNMAGRSIGILAYGYLPLMLFRSCPMRSKNGCSGCSGREKLTDRTKTEFTVLCSEKKYSELLNSLPLYIGDRDVSSVDFETLYFTVETRQRCQNVYNMFADGAEFDEKRTAGLYYRELL